MHHYHRLFICLTQSDLWLQKALGWIQLSGGRTPPLKPKPCKKIGIVKELLKPLVRQMNLVLVTCLRELELRRTLEQHSSG